LSRAAVLSSNADVSIWRWAECLDDVNIHVTSHRWMYDVSVDIFWGRITIM